MNQWKDISRDELQRLFSIVIYLDEAMNITYASDTLRHYLPEVENHPNLTDVFEILRPGNLDNFAAALKSMDSLCLMTAINGKFAIRGQLIRTRDNDESILCLCGAPWLFWMASNCPEIRLGLSDFSPQDVQLDQLFYMSTEKQMVTDLENLNTELTEAKKNLEEARDAQYRFFAQISHEMRTPLNGVVSALSLLGGSPDDDQRELLVSLARSSSKNLMDVINYVLDLSKLELVGEEQDRIFDLPELVRSTTEIVAAKAREKALGMRLELAADIPRHCTGNPSRIRQVLLNLIMNAIKFTNFGTVTVRVHKIAGDTPDCTLRFSVVDTGIGIAEELQKCVFEPFWSMPPGGGKEAENGTGLGLDIVRRNVERMGGNIDVLSEQGVGSTFSFDLPMTAASERTTYSVETPMSEADDSGVKLSGSILLVDDNETNLLLGKMIMESIGLRVCTAENGAEAVIEAWQRDLDLVLMDIHMPGIDGLEATRQIRNFKDEQSLPIVALTALAYDKEKDACLDSGMNGYLTKPIVAETLTRELSRWLPSDPPSPVNRTTSEKAGEKQSLNLVGLVDHAVLQEMRRQIGQDNLTVVLTKVIEEVAQRWEELTSAYKVGDWSTVTRHVHSLSSILRSVGIASAADEFGAIEEVLRAGDDLSDGWLENLENTRSLSLDALVATLGEY